MSPVKAWKRIWGLAPLCGILGPGIIFVGILITGLAYVGVEGQRYTILNHFVSELGELGVSEAAVVFNGSLLIGGLISTFFMVYLTCQIEHWIRYPLGLLSITAALSGALVGVYPMNYLIPHIRAAMAFFNLGMLMAFLYSLVFLFGKRHPFPKWLAIPGLLNAAAFTFFNNFPTEFEAGVDFQESMANLLTHRPDFIPLALMEWIVILGILIWVSLMGIYLGVNRRSATS
jgi:hypothetical membrane protein